MYRHAPLVFLLSVGLLSGTALAAPTSVVTLADANEMMAASPQREMRRDWVQCLLEASRLALINGTTKAQAFERFSYKACEEKESQLTGWLVREFGRRRADGAVMALKNGLAPAFARLEQDLARKPRDFVTQTEAGWIISRDGTAACSAKLSSGGMMPFVSQIKRDHGTWRITFASGVSYANKYSRHVGEADRLNVVAHGSSNDGASRIEFRVSAIFEVGSDYYGFSVPIDQVLINSLHNAETVQFNAPLEVYPVPMIVPVRGFDEAWALVQRCK